jgi:signal transduction histidine kinase
VIEMSQVGLVERYRRLLEISRDLASTLDLDTLLNRIVQAAADLSVSQAASILLYDEMKQQLYFEAATNLAEPVMRGLVVPVENSIAGWVLLHCQPLIIPDTRKDPRHFRGVDKVSKISTISLLAVPLVAKKRVIGVLEAVNKQVGGFDLEDQELLLSLGAQAAVAIENSRLFQQSDLISEIIHELRTPLTSLSTAARLLQRPELSTEMRRSILDIILSETNRLSEMTTSFLDLARLESGRAGFKLRTFDLGLLLEECVAQMQGKAQERDIRIGLNIIISSLPLLRADRDKVKQVVLNLLSNAIKYNFQGGNVELSASVEVDEASQQLLVVHVSDSGPGIPASALPLIFTKFYRVPQSEMEVQGTGLGLSICQRIVEAHHGRIEVESEVGKGTTFSVYLPLVASGFD